ncbi:DUF2905 domain-containing protein [Selenomonas bovis]|uniref:DUF2905 domain-containing protein n=1 Tax=Selenomonas bovis TaxID=416586 RepID=A0A848B7P0_9FIRM|nr:DUF2905 domain-containing protein [Selenomonas bovis]
MGRFLTSIGILLVIGLLMEFGGKFLPLGHLPGDIHITSEHGSFYFPIVICVVISIILSVLLNFFGR